MRSPGMALHEYLCPCYSSRHSDSTYCSTESSPLFPERNGQNNCKWNKVIFSMEVWASHKLGADSSVSKMADRIVHTLLTISATGGKELHRTTVQGKYFVIFKTTSF